MPHCCPERRWAKIVRQVSCSELFMANSFWREKVTVRESLRVLWRMLLLYAESGAFRLESLAVFVWLDELMTVATKRSSRRVYGYGFV